MNAMLAVNNVAAPTAAPEPSASRTGQSAKVRSTATADDDWEQDYLAQVALAEQRERIFSSSYLPEPTGRFFIH